MKFEKGAIVTAPNGKQYTRNEGEALWPRGGRNGGCFFDSDIETLIEDHDWKLSYPEKPKSVFSGTVSSNWGNAIVMGVFPTEIAYGTEVLVIPKEKICLTFQVQPRDGQITMPASYFLPGDHRVIVVKDEGGQGE